MTLYLPGWVPLLLKWVPPLPTGSLPPSGWLRLGLAGVPCVPALHPQHSQSPSPKSPGSELDLAGAESRSPLTLVDVLRVDFLQLGLGGGSAPGGEGETAPEKREEGFMGPKGANMAKTEVGGVPLADEKRKTQRS